MARKLLCPVCDAARAKLAIKYKELYESVAGKSIGEFLCDGCHLAKPIHVGDLCYAAVELPSKEHPNYRIQKPETWMNDYLIPV